MQYKVPQNVQREDQILWFMTLKQLGLVMIGAGISYWIYVTLSKQYRLGSFETFIVWIPAMIAAAFAFIRIKHVSLMQFFLLLFEQLFVRSRRRSWVQGAGNPFISMTTKVVRQKEKKKKSVEEKEYSVSKVKHLASVLDGEKSDLQKRKGI